MEFDEEGAQTSWWSDDQSATSEPTDFGPSNQLQKVWTGQDKKAGTKVSVGGRYTEENVAKVEVTPYHGETPGTTVEAQTVRDGLFIARGVEPYDRSDNEFEAVVTDKADRTSTAATATGVDFDGEVLPGDDRRAGRSGRLVLGGRNGGMMARILCRAFGAQ